MTETPTPVPADGFDIIMTKGNSLIVDLNPPPPSEDDEEEEIPPYAPGWDSVQLDISGGEPELNGYRYAMKYWQSVETPGVGEEPPTYSKVYPTWILVSQTITKSSPSRQVFFTDTGNELFPTPPGAGSQIGDGGITDGTKYGYLLVFDQAEISWLPRCSTYNQENVTKGTPPDGMVQPDLPYPWYPMDTLGAFIPDPRESVTISYTVETNYKLSEDGVIQTHTFVIKQNCTQNPELSSEKLEALLDKCYFTHGFYHTQLYDIDAPPNYDEYGNPIGEVKEPIYLKNEADSELVGFPVYDLQNSVWNENGMDQIPEQEAASEIALEETIAEGEEQIKDLKDIMSTTQQDYEAEVASIEQVQQENATVIAINKERQTQLLGNIKNMIVRGADVYNQEDTTPEATEQTTSTTQVPSPTVRQTTTQTQTTQPSTPPPSNTSSGGGY